MNVVSGTGVGRVRLTAIPVVYKVFMTMVWALLCAGWFALLIATAAAPELQDRGALFSLFVAIGLFTVTFLALPLAQVCRFAVWIEGTTIVVRQWNGEKRWNLASTAVVVRRSPLMVRLTLQDGMSGRRMRLRLRETRLQNVNALAGVIIAARPGDPAASRAAEALLAR